MGLFDDYNYITRRQTVDEMCRAGYYMDTDIASKYPRFTVKDSKQKHKTDGFDTMTYIATINPYIYDEMRFMDDFAKIKEALNMKWGIAGVSNKLPEIKNVIFNDPATIVFWSDGTKTVVKAQSEKFDPEKGLAMAICKKVLGNKGNFNNLFKKWLPKEEVKKERTVIGKIISTDVDKGGVTFNASIFDKELLDKLLNETPVSFAMEFAKDDDTDPFEE